MSQLKTKFDSASIKNKFVELLEGIDRNNTSRMIVERYYGKLASLEIAEGSISAKDAYTELTGKGVEQNQARHIASSSTLSEAKTSIADSYLLGRIQLMESAIKELKAYDWMPNVKTFIKESTEFINENQTLILIESVIRDLELDRNAKFYTRAIESLREASTSETPDFAVVELVESEVWIPLVKKLYEYCNSKKGTITGQNPNFKVSKLYSPVEAIDENTFVFHASGKLLEMKDDAITESTANVDDSFKSLIKLAESAKIGSNQMRLYPNTNSVLDISFGEETKVSLNGKVVESEILDKHLITAGFVKINEQEKLGMIQRAINEGNKIIELDFGYSVKSTKFDGVSVNVFNVNENIYIQKVNKGMKENSLVLAESASDAVSIVKEFMNYDISESINHILENEKAEMEKRTAELNKVEGRIKFIIEKLADIDAAEKSLGKSEFIDQAKELLESQLIEQIEILEKVKAWIAEGVKSDMDINSNINESHFKVGDKVKCIKSGMTGEVTKLDKDHGADDEKYYTVKLEDGTEKKYAPNELAINESSTTFDPTKETAPTSGDVKLTSKDDLVAGKEYTIKGQTGYIFQGDADGNYIFNQKDETSPTPLHMKESEVETMIASGEITQ